MPTRKEGEGAPQEPKEHNKAIQKAQEQEAFSQEFWNTFMELARVIPVSEDPAFWPVFMLSEVRDVIGQREHIRDTQKRGYVEKLAALEGTLRNVETAYKIIAYPHCTQEHLRDLIGSSLETDRQAYGRDQVTLTDAEVEIVRRICETPRYALTVDESGRHKEPVPILLPNIPVDPQQRVYRYADVPVAPDIDPLGRRHLTTHAIRRRIAREKAKQR